MAEPEWMREHFGEAAQTPKKVTGPRRWPYALALMVSAALGVAAWQAGLFDRLRPRIPLGQLAQAEEKVAEQTATDLGLSQPATPAIPPPAPTPQIAPVVAVPEPAQADPARAAKLRSVTARIANLRAAAAMKAKEVGDLQAAIEKDQAVLAKVQRENTVGQFYRRWQETPDNPSPDKTAAKIAYDNLLVDIRAAQRRVAENQEYLATKQRALADYNAQLAAATDELTESTAR
jgi:hypothetical protein